MDITLIAIALFLLLAIVILILFLFKSINKKSYKADDGSVFYNKSNLELYQNLYKKTKPLFSLDDDKSDLNDLLGFDKTFLTKLTKVGFSDLKTLVKYRNQFKLLTELINI
tara:strand:+ start:520 stop:852 length:333 start_codon:yes stop_codon:yes gene_type:complete